MSNPPLNRAEETSISTETGRARDGEESDRRQISDTIDNHSSMANSMQEMRSAEELCTSSEKHRDQQLRAPRRSHPPEEKQHRWNDPGTQERATQGSSELQVPSTSTTTTLQIPPFTCPHRCGGTFATWRELLAHLQNPDLRECQRSRTLLPISQH